MHLSAEHAFCVMSSHCSANCVFILAIWIALYFHFQCIALYMLHYIAVSCIALQQESALHYIACICNVELHYIALHCIALQACLVWFGWKDSGGGLFLVWFALSHLHWKLINELWPARTTNVVVLWGIKPPLSLCTALTRCSRFPAQGNTFHFFSIFDV
jgi:hypothetical protein